LFSSLAIAGGIHQLGVEGFPCMYDPCCSRCFSALLKSKMTARKFPQNSPSPGKVRVAKRNVLLCWIRDLMLKNLLWCFANLRSSVGTSAADTGSF